MAELNFCGGQLEEKYENQYFGSLNNIQTKSYNGAMYILSLLIIFLLAVVFQVYISLLSAVRIFLIWIAICSAITVNVYFVFNGRYLFCGTTVTLIWNLVSIISVICVKICFYCGNVNFESQ